MDYDELLLRLQRFAGDGEGYEGGGGAAPGFNNDISGDTAPAGDGNEQVEANSEEIQNSQEQLEQVKNNMVDDTNAVQTEVTRLTEGAMDQESQEDLQTTMNEAGDQMADFTAAIGTLATFAGSVLEAYQANSEQIHNEITEWTSSFKTILSGISEGLNGRDASGNQVEQGSISQEEFKAQTTENTSTIFSGMVKISEGTREVVRGTVQQFADTGRYYTSTTGTTPLGAFKNLISGVLGGGGAEKSATGSFVSRVMGLFTTSKA